jgi:VIT1/CCC1 family predicted Fe2+/Mn2+ transporter
MTIADPRQSLENLKLERDAIVLYDALAAIEKDPLRRAAFTRIASNERRHADIWARRLESEGHRVPAAGGPRPRVRFIILVARLFGTRSVADLVRALEGDEEDLYTAQSSPEVAAIAADEREHAEIWKRLESAELEPATGAAGMGGAGPVADGGAGAGVGAGGASAAVGALQPSQRAVPPPIEHPRETTRREAWHRSGQSGTLRATIFGVSDGLVSNLSLVMGVAGAAQSNSSFILLAGIAGLLSGAFSMAAGEYVSMQSQRELFERQIALERAELEAAPEEEAAELAGIYRAKGFTEEEAARIARRLLADPEHALDTLIREELGLDPDELGSPWGAALGSFLAFAVGALIPVLPYLVGDGALAFQLSLGLSLAALFAVGAGVSLLTGRGILFGGARQALIGLAAAAVTYGVGRLIGVAVA